MRTLPSSKKVCLAVIVAYAVCFRLAASAQQQSSPDLATSHPRASTYTESVLVNFTGSDPPDYGDTPYGNLIQASNGNFYGTTIYGGMDGDGNVYGVSAQGVYSQLYSFAGQGTIEPGAGVVQGADGNFYGTTFAGGDKSLGTVYRVTPDGTMSIIHSFDGGADDGEYPIGPPVQGTDGNLYGTTTLGGPNTDECPDEGCGTVFKISPDGSTYTVLHSFGDSTTDGELLFGGLVQGSDGNFYGMTSNGGANGYGTVFKISSDGTTYTVLHSFTGEDAGAYPYASLIEGSDGNFYGTTTGKDTYGDTSGYGNVFKIAPDGNTFTVLHAFAGGTTDGESGLFGLVLATDGNFYGTTPAGGEHGTGGGYGTIYNITSTGSFSLLYSLGGGTADGGIPKAGLVQGTDGNFYGDTYEGGTGAIGVVYKLSVAPALTAPVQLTVPDDVEAGATFRLSYSVFNAYSDTLQQCFATNTAGDMTGWVGIKVGSHTATEVTLTASSTPGTYTYTLTCGGMETGITTLNVTNVTADITFSSVTHNMGSVLIGNSTTYGVQLTNHTGNVFPFALTLSTTASPNPFSYQTNCGTSVAAYAQCEIVFTYAPKSGNTGTQTATWSLAPNGFTFGPSNGGTLTGTVATAAHLTVTTAGHNWGDQTVGTTSPVYGVVLTNSTPNNLNMTYALGNTTDFSLVTNCPALLGTGISCNLNFTFIPKTTGFLSTTESLTATDAKTSDPVTIYILGSSTPVTGISLKGTGSAP